jgi:2-methylcitrate dehydratase PrpD
MQQALGITGSMGAGLRVNFGTMTKPFHSGRAAQNGVLAARLARAGFGSTREMLDSPWGFFQVLGGGCDCDFVKEHLGRSYNMVSPGISIKPYPCGSLAHPTMDAMLELRQEHGIDPQNIDSIEVAVASNVLDALLHSKPENPLEAKFSLPFGITLIALKGKAGVNEYKQQVVDDPNVQEFMQKVHCFVDEQIEAKGYDKMYGMVTVRLHNGGILSKDAEIARGYPEKPLSRKELSDKFTECALLSLPAEKAEMLVKLVVDQMDELGDLKKVTSLLSK